MCVCVSLTVLNCIKSINKKDSLYLVIGTVAILGKDDDRPRVYLYTLVELFASHIPHSWTRRDETRWEKEKKREREKKSTMVTHVVTWRNIMTVTKTSWAERVRPSLAQPPIIPTQTHHKHGPCNIPLSGWAWILDCRWWRAGGREREGGGEREKKGKHSNYVQHNIQCIPVL